MFNKVDYAMLTISDMPKSVSFYRDILGLPLKFESPHWTEFQTGATTLALHGGGKPRAKIDPQETGTAWAGTCTIGFQVPDIDKTYQELKAKGVNFVMTPTSRQEEGIKLALCLDPDGLPISLAETLN